MSVGRVCIEAGDLLRTYFSEAGYLYEPPYVVFYAKVLDDKLEYVTADIHVNSLVGMNKYEVVDRLLSLWL